MLEHGGRWRAAHIAHIPAVALVQRGLWLALTGLAALGSLDA